MSVYRQLLKHSGVYALGEVLARSASILLLPLYLHYLDPADWAIVGLTDVITGVLAILVSQGITSAVSRYHFDETYANSQHALWVTGLVVLVILAFVLLTGTWLARGVIADWVLMDLKAGVDLEAASTYVSLALAVLAANFVARYTTTYLRVLKRSKLYVVQQLMTLLLQIVLNIKFIAFDELGVTGFFYSGIISGASQGALLLVVLFAGKSLRIIPEVFPKIVRFGWPFIISGLASLAMHQADRYLLKTFLGLELTGVYSLAHNIVMAVNSLLLLPFCQIWSVTIYEIDPTPERLQVFRKIFKYFVLALSLVLLAVALFSESALRVIGKQDFYLAARIIPIHCLAFTLYSIHALFSVPPLIHKKTRSVALTALVAAGVSVAANCLFIPWFGVFGAALASIVTYATYSFFGNWRYSKIENLGYPIRYVFGCIVVGAAIVAGWHFASVALIGSAFALALGNALLTLFRAVAADHFALDVLRENAFTVANILISMGVATVGWLLAVVLVIWGPARELFEPGSPIHRWWSQWRERRAPASEPAE